MKTVTIRMPKDLHEKLQAQATQDSLNTVIVKRLEELTLLQTNATNEIKNTFTQNEWKYIVDALNGSLAMGSFRYYKSVLIATLEDAERFDGLCAKWEVNLQELTSKINSLHGANIDAIYTRVEQYWNKPTDIEEWSVF